jgi:ligand-binding sensor domain-containing protein
VFYLKFINTIAFDHQGRTWIGTSNGVAVLDGEVWTSYTPQNSGLKHRVVETIFEDQQQQILVWTMDGVQVFDGEDFTSYDPPTLPGGTVVDSAKDSKGRLWLGLRGENYSSCFGTLSGSSGTDESTVSMYDGKVSTSYDWKQMEFFKGPYTIQAIAVDKQDQVWVATTGGLHAFDGKQ